MKILSRANLLLLVGVLLSLSLQAQVAEDFDLYRVHLPSGYVDQVTNLPGTGEFNADYSPFGFRVIHDLVTLGSYYDLGITNIYTGVTTPLPGADGGNDASWSPNGLFIAFDRVPVGDHSIYIVPSWGGTPTLFLEDAVDADWSPNNRRLVYTDVTDGSIKTIHVLTGNTTTVVPFGLYPSWSPNGRFIAYCDGFNIFKIRVSTNGQPIGNEVQLTDEDPGIQSINPSWSGNSRKIVFQSNRGVGNEVDIWMVNANGGSPTWLAGFPGVFDVDPVMPKWGRWVLFSSEGDGTPPPAFGPDISSEEQTIGEHGELLSLYQNYPNPFVGSTIIRFSLAEASHVRLSIYNMDGTCITTLLEDDLVAGKHQISWDGIDHQGRIMPSGLYTCTLEVGAFSTSKRMLRIRH